MTATIIASIDGGSADFARAFEIIQDAVHSMVFQLSEARQLEFTRFGSATLMHASLATAYLTSIWLWLALIFTPIVRILVWSRTTGLTAIGRILDAQNKPMVALGYATALVILACGSLVWGVGHALATMVR